MRVWSSQKPCVRCSTSRPSDGGAGNDFRRKRHQQGLAAREHDMDRAEPAPEVPHDGLPVVGAGRQLLATIFPDIAVHTPRVAPLGQQDGDRRRPAMSRPASSVQRPEPVVDALVDLGVCGRESARHGYLSFIELSRAKDRACYVSMITREERGHRWPRSSILGHSCEIGVPVRHPRNPPRGWTGMVVGNLAPGPGASAAGPNPEGDPGGRVEDQE